MIDLTEARIAFIGGGKMGEAILGGWIAAQDGPAAAIVPGNVIVANPGLERRRYLEERYGVSCVADACEIKEADIVVLAVKPQVMFGMLETVRDSEFMADALCVSIAAGISTERLQDALPSSARVVRTMPNTPLLVREGVTAVCSSASSSADDVELVEGLFASLGLAFQVDESLMDVVGALSGSGPAYVAAFVEHLRDAAVAQGMDRSIAEQSILRTVAGTVSLIGQTGQTPEEARIAVCSPGGSTLAALAAMDKADFSGVCKAGIDAAVARNKELGAC